MQQFRKPRPVHILLAFERKRAGFTQKQVTQLLNLGAMTVSKWERGVRMPSEKDLKRLAALYGCPVACCLRAAGVLCKPNIPQKCSFGTDSGKSSIWSF